MIRYLPYPSHSCRGLAPVAVVFSGDGTAVPARGNSPSIIEGVAGGRGSNIKHQNSL
ncbi:MAG: hypothetical protein IKZ54_11265 [Bacteroidales bacterium]|nr:hypothetical protein [Bacteroidales bacterium]